jgi:hypothetical protein
MATTAIARPSVASLFVHPSDGKTDLGSGTAFLTERNGTTFLLTNWHNVTGKNPQTGALLDQKGRVPTHLRIFHNYAPKLGEWVERVEPLYDANGVRLWKEHPRFPNGQVDAVALPLTELADTVVYGHDLWATGGPAMGASEPVNIIGFPFGLTSGGYVAIWVRGAIASEPAMDFTGLPCFLVDARTRPGQSGSPVILYATGSYSDEDGSFVVQSGAIERLVGIYSGRVNAESDLGFVWKVEALREIIENGI